MAIRNIRTSEDEILRKVSKPVKEITPRILQLIEDMIETMEYANGVGLAAVQVGVLRRVVVIDVGQGPFVLINPKVVEKSSEEVIENEACLSVIDYAAYVSRPTYIKVKALDENGKEVEVEGRGLLAKALCHELDHLDGILYIDKELKLTEEEIEEIENKNSNS